MKNHVVWIMGGLFLAGIAFFFVFLQNENVKQKRFTIAVINPNPGSETIDEKFVEHLQEYGRQEGWQLEFQQCKTKETFDADLKKILSGQPDLLFTVTTPGTKKTIKACGERNIPGVCVVFDPVSAGIIQDLSHPGGNFTGIQLRGSVPKALEWLLAVAPGIKNIYVPVKFDTEATKMSLADLQKTAKTFGIQVTVAELDSKEDLDRVLGSIPAEMDAIFLVNSIFISTHTKEIVETAIRRKLPTASSMGKCEEGIMVSYSTRHPQSGKQASRLAYLILQGENPGDIPAEIVDFYLCVSLQTAEKIGAEISDSVLAQADEIIR